jgi:uncharacterized protein (TIGR02001 family)
MKKLLLATAISGLFALPHFANAQTTPAAAAPAPTPEHTFTGNATLVTDYRFRGVSQTYLQPAVQAGFDYAHSSGFYLGTWASNVTGNMYTNGAGMEWDMYGGFKGTVSGDLGFDVGLLNYWYPAAHYNNPPKTKFNNLELYGALSYKWLTAKYNYTLSDFFGVNNDTYGGACQDGRTGNATDCFAAQPGDSKGSGYFDLTGNFEIADKLTLAAHVGNQTVHNYSKLNYTDWKIGLTKDYNGWLFGIAYIGTNAKHGWYTVSEAGSPSSYKVVSKDTLMLSVGKTF